MRPIAEQQQGLGPHRTRGSGANRLLEEISGSGHLAECGVVVGSSHRSTPLGLLQIVRGQGTSQLSELSGRAWRPAIVGLTGRIIQRLRHGWVGPDGPERQVPGLLFPRPDDLGEAQVQCPPPPSRDS